MSVFFIAAALLVMAALLFIVPPLLKRDPAETGANRGSLNVSIYQDQFAELERDLANDVISREQYEQSRQELERRLLEDVPASEQDANVDKGSLGRSTVISAVIIAGLLPLVAAGVYMQTGTPSAIVGNGERESTSASAAASDIAPGTIPGDMQHQIDQMIARLEQRLADNPNDVEGWTMLGRSYLALEKFDQALPALEKAVSLGGTQPQLLVDYADVLAMTSSDMSLEGRPMELIEQALDIDPRNQKALWLAGTAAYERGNYREALDYWRRLRSLVPEGSEAAQAMEGNIAEIEALIGQDGGAPPPPPEVAAASGATLRGTIGIDDELRSRVDPSDPVFIFARAVDGPRMPLAVMRARAGDLPIEYVLDDSMAMNPSLSLSQFSEVVVVARVSRSGSPIAESGDLEGQSEVVRTRGEQPVRVQIDEVIP